MGKSLKATHVTKPVIDCRLDWQTQGIADGAEAGVSGELSGGNSMSFASGPCSSSESKSLSVKVSSSLLSKPVSVPGLKELAPRIGSSSLSLVSLSLSPGGGSSGTSAPAASHRSSKCLAYPMRRRLTHSRRYIESRRVPRTSFHVLPSLSRTSRRLCTVVEMERKAGQSGSQSRDGARSV
ncbi:hypothetical protein KC363_g201 [Hortaea werneckii]|nr:hypothetical protein KC363_g201 [Hortaea werneckii]